MRVQEHTIDLAGAPVFYRSAGPGPLYLHGVPTSSEDWVPFLERTGGVAPDLLGFGASAKGGHLDFTLTGLATFVERFAGALKLEPVPVVAHDWGVGVALELARRQPERIERLAIINGVPVLSGFRWPWFARAWQRPIVGELSMGAMPRAVFNRILRSGNVSPDAWDSERLRTIWEQFDQGTQRAILRLYRSIPHDRFDPPIVQAPSLVIWGAGDPWLPTALGQAYAQHLGAQSFEPIAQAGHWPWLDRPDTIDRVARFLA